MTLQELSRIHCDAFAPARGWSENEIRDLLEQDTTRLYAQPGGFAIVQTVAGEAELLTLAVAPAFQRQGVAAGLMKEWLSTAEPDLAFLEVAKDNAAAIALYQQFGFHQVGERKAYYTRANGVSVDAMLMRLAPPHENTGVSAPNPAKTG